MKDSNQTLGFLKETIRKGLLKRVDQFLAGPGRPTVIVLAIWFLFACTQVGFDSPDEHFPTLEAAGFLLWGHGNLTWEFGSGLRSWLQPALTAAWIWPLRELGVESRLILDAWARVGLALLTFAALPHFKRIFGPRTWTVVPRVALAFAPWVVWGTRHGSDTFVIPFFCIASAWLLRLHDARSRSWVSSALITGFWVGVSVEIRFLAGVPLALLGLGLLIQRRLGVRSAVLVFVSACVVLGFTEWADAQVYRHLNGVTRFPIWEFFRFNILEGSGQFHESPRFEATLYGCAMFLLATGFQWSLLRRWVRRPQLEMLPLWGATLGSLLLFGLVRHQELRFVFCLFPWIVALTLADAEWVVLARWFKVQSVVLVLAWWIYSDPHGMLVRALDSIAPETQKINFVGVHGNLPEFYLQSQAPKIWMETEEWQRSCGTAEFWVEGLVVVASESCLRLPDFPFVSERPIPLSLGYRLRQLISTTQAPRFVYQKFVQRP